MAIHDDMELHQYNVAAPRKHKRHNKTNSYSTVELVQHRRGAFVEINTMLSSVASKDATSC